jgi:galactose-1-phosphate uridylyltransferase
MFKLKSFSREAKLLNPLKNFEAESKIIEYRTNPLTGRVGCILLKDSERPFDEMIYTSDEESIKKLVEESREKCFFCPDKVEEVTPKFPEEIFPEGRVKVGETTLFPNLFPYCEFSVIAVLTKKHYLDLEEFTPNIFVDGFKAIKRFAEKIVQIDSLTKHIVVGLQYLPPAGSSIIHPHMQAMLTKVPLGVLKEIIEASKRYYRRHSSNYWKDLVNFEKENGERYIGNIGNVEWITPFTPVSEYEVLGVVKEKSSFLELDEEDFKSLAEGICKILKFFSQKKFSCFQFTLDSGSINQKLEYFWVNLRVTARPGLRQFYVNDSWFMPYLVRQPIINLAPEELAKTLRGYF